MSSLKKLISMLESLEKDLTICMRCGMCHSVCPVYMETRLESDVARGKLAVVDGLRRAILEKPDGVAERLNRCLLCGSCEIQCPSGVKAVEIFLKARAIISQYKGLSPTKRLILRKILTHPNRFHRVLDFIESCQNLILTLTDPQRGTSCSRIPLPLIKKRHITPLAHVPFHKRISPLPIFFSKTPTIAIFTGCLIDRVFPSIGESTLKILNRLETGIYLPENQLCCGMPALSSGDLIAFGSLVRKNVELFGRKDYEILVTACATCTAVIKNLWPTMLEVVTKDLDLIQRVHRISEKVMDITQFLARYTKIPKSYKGNAASLKVTYHDPCHLRKSLKIWKEPREVLSSMQTYRFVEMAEADACCGLGGSFGLEYGNLSERIGFRKVQNIVHSEADVVATSCPACMIQLSDMLSRAGMGKPVRHIVELYAEDLKS